MPRLSAAHHQSWCGVTCGIKCNHFQSPSGRWLRALVLQQERGCLRVVAGARRAWEPGTGKESQHTRPVFPSLQRRRSMGA
eukprot:163799-Rhodomonas_salina.1